MEFLVRASCPADKGRYRISGLYFNSNRSSPRPSLARNTKIWGASLRACPAAACADPQRSAVAPARFRCCGPRRLLRTRQRCSDYCSAVSNPGAVRDARPLTLPRDRLRRRKGVEQGVPLPRAGQGVQRLQETRHGHPSCPAETAVGESGRRRTSSGLLSPTKGRRSCGFGSGLSFRTAEDRATRRVMIRARKPGRAAGNLLATCSSYPCLL
ncbi:hypothetical protein DFJ74DRAFT_476251 [Hyaloraphidium curvatum]|nr:hypothetical protein DFJ74DRAFT_476251 [Hyaloraphidium curvatum]